jgi:peptidoglycan/LPS O-acetylase OafA/YrhL
MVKTLTQHMRSLPRLGEIMAPEANSFGVLRLAMATLVLISHSYLYAYGTSETEPLTAWTGHSLGEHAVQVFFILSGILVAQSYERSRSLIDFATARLLRIFPALVVCVLLTAFILGPAVSACPVQAYFGSSLLPAYILKTLALTTGSAPLPGVFNRVPLANNVNTSLWTLKYEVLCYAGLAFAGWAGLFAPRWRFRAAFALALFLLAISTNAPKDVATFTFSDNFRYFLLYFGTGVCAYLVRDRLVVSGAMMVPLAFSFVMAIGTRYGEFATALLLCNGVVWLAGKSFGPLRNFCNRIDLSFGVYIFAGPIQQAVIDTLPSPAPVSISMLAALFVFPLAVLSWVFIEHPALQLRRRVSQMLTKEYVRRSLGVHWA